MNHSKHITWFATIDMDNINIATSTIFSWYEYCNAGFFLNSIGVKSVIVNNVSMNSVICAQCQLARGICEQRWLKLANKCTMLIE